MFSDKRSQERASSTAGFEGEESRNDISNIPVHVNRVNIGILSRTHNDYITRAADGLFKAKTFQELMVETINAKSYLNSLGIFKNVGVAIDISREPNASDIDYDVTFTGKELSRVLGTAGTEVGQNEGALQVQFNLPNIFGRGERISMQYAYTTTKTNDASLKFWKPFFHTRFHENRPELSFSIFRNIERKDISLFQRSNVGVNADLTFTTFLPIKLTHSFQYEAARRIMSLTGRSVPFDIRVHSGPKLASLVRHEMVYDQRDNSVFPTTGILVKATNEYCGLGGNISYMRHMVHGEANKLLFGDVVLQVAGRVGIIRETRKTKALPISDFFYCGGPLTLRGFRYGCAGPVIDGTPIGAQLNWSAGLHLWAPLPFSYTFRGLANNLRTHLFYNFGNFNSFSTENMRSAAGLGLALRLGDRARIEFNYCIPLHKYETDAVANGFQFGIGYEFV